MAKKYLSIGEAAEVLGVSVDTLRRWEKEGKIQSERTDGGHRRYRSADLIKTNTALTLCYARVSTRDRKEDLERQANVLAAYCEAQNWEYRVIKDLGSGMNYKKKGLNQLIDLILNEEISRIVITNKDRLLRFGAELIFGICERCNVEVVILNRKEDSSFEEDLAADVLEIITVFSARLYGSRSKKNLKLIESLTNSWQESSKKPV